jgi:hypothetical protein
MTHSSKLVNKLSEDTIGGLNMKLDVQKENTRVVTIIIIIIIIIITMMWRSKPGETRRELNY